MSNFQPNHVKHPSNAPEIAINATASFAVSIQTNCPLMNAEKVMDF